VLSLVSLIYVASLTDWFLDRLGEWLEEVRGKGPVGWYQPPTPTESWSKATPPVKMFQCECKWGPVVADSKAWKGTVLFLQ